MAPTDFLRIGPKPEIAVEYAGSGPFVLFMHGVGGNRRNWSDQIAGISGRYRAAAWDARGWGDSDDYDGALRMADICDDIDRVLDRFEVERVHIVGLSMGGFVALEYYARAPGRFRSLTLVDTSATIASDMTLEQRAEFVRLRKTPLLEGKTPKDIAPAMVATLLSPKAGPAVRARLEASISMLHPESYMKAVDMVVDFNRSDVPPTIRVPTLCVVGSDDRLTPPNVMKALADRIPGAEYVEIPDAGHLVNIEAPEAFNRALLAFLDNQPRD